jgi:hypothetical protein
VRAGKGPQQIVGVRVGGQQPLVDLMRIRIDKVRSLRAVCAVCAVVCVCVYVCARARAVYEVCAVWC